MKGDTTLYAIWEDEPSLNCTISFNANGGRGFMNNGDAISGSNYELPINGFTSPDGYKFEAWAEGSTSGTQYKEKEPYTVSANTTFYAIWEKLPTVSISASSTSISGGGSVTLTTSPAADSVTCSDTSIVVTGSGNTWKATLPNTTASYTFSALAGGYINGSCTVSVTHVHKGGTATCQSPAVCDDCGKPYGNKDMNNHSGETEIRDKKDATDTQEGYTGDRYCLGCNTKIATGSVIPATGGSIQPPTEKLTIIRNTELKEVPESLKSTNFNTVEKIKNELVRVMTLQSGYTETNTSIYDVKMRVTIDGGETWVDATESDFPTEGITVKLPYPSGTGKDSHDFVVAHMFTVTSKRLGTVAGQIETPEVTKLDDGIQVTLKGLSPVSIAWKDISSDEGDETDGTTTPVTPIDMVEPTVSTTNVNTEENESKSLSNVLKTGDNTNIKFYFGTMITSLIGLFAFVVTRKKKGAK